MPDARCDAVSRGIDGLDEGLPPISFAVSQLLRHFWVRASAGPLVQSSQDRLAAGCDESTDPRLAPPLSQRRVTSEVI